MFIISNQMRGTFLVALSGMLYGILGYTGTKLLDEHFSIENMLFWRFFIAIIWISIPVIIKKNRISKITNYSAFIKMITFAVLTYSGSSIFYFFASQQTGTGVAMVIFFSYPVYVALFAFVLSQWEINKLAIFSLVMVVVGLFLLKGQGENTLTFVGVLYGLIAALFYAVYVHGSQHSAKTIDSGFLTMLICFGNMLIFLLLSFYTHSFSFPQNINAWFYILALGILATALPIQLLLDGLKYISPLKASILSVLEPVVTVILGLLLLNEEMTSLQMLGVIVILVGAILIQFEKAPDPFIERG